MSISVLRAHADAIVREAISAVQPDAAVRRALEQQALTGRCWSRPERLRGRWQTLRTMFWVRALPTVWWLRNTAM